MPRDFFKGDLYWRESRSQWQGVLTYYDKDGKRHQKTKLFGGKKRAAQDAFQEWKDELNRKARLISPQEIIQEPSRKSVGDRVREYVTYLDTQVLTGNMEQSTLTCKVQAAKLYIYPEPIAELPYEKLAKDDILEWERGLRERGISNGTIGIPFSLLRRIYNYDIEHGAIQDTPFRFLKSPKAEKRNVNYATDRTLRKLHEVLGERWKKDRGNPYTLAYYLALYTGMRSQEICGLAWKDVHLPQGMIEVTQAIGRNGSNPYLKSPKNPTSYRKIPLTEEAIELLRVRKKRVCWDEEVDEPRPNWFVIGERDEFLPPQWLTQDFGRFCRKHDIVGSEGTYLTMHGLRDTLATIGVQEKTIDIKSLSAILGHSNTAMTLNTYAGFGDDAMRAAGMRGIGEAMKRKVQRDD